MQRPQPDPQRLPPRAPSPLAPRGFGGGAAALWIGESSSSQAAAAAAAAAARDRVTEQMAYEDVWKACNPDFRTPFASVEDAVSRLLPYHVFAEYGEDDMVDAHPNMTKSSAEKFTDEMEDMTLNLITEFEKQVLAFNVIARGRAEEQCMLERALLQDERRLSEHVRALMVQQEQQQQRQDEAARTRLALVQAQAQVASAWQLAQEQAQAQAHARAEALAAAMARGEGFPGFTGQMAAPGVAMARGEGFPGFAGHPQHDPAAARAWQMMMQQQQQLGMGVWPNFVAPHDEGSSSGHARAPAVLQDQSAGQTTSAAAAAGTMQQWLRIAAQQREQ